MNWNITLIFYQNKAVPYGHHGRFQKTKMNVMTTLATCILQNNNSLKAETIIEIGGHKRFYIRNAFTLNFERKIQQVISNWYKFHFKKYWRQPPTDGKQTKFKKLLEFLTHLNFEFWIKSNVIATSRENLIFLINWADLL